MARSYTRLFRLLQLLVCATAANVMAHDCYDYKTLDDIRRSTGYETPFGEEFCDRDLEEGWYRAVSAAGGDMPTNAPYYERCGTIWPVWYNGDMPANEGEIEEGDNACVVGFGDPCVSTLPIKVQNCGAYNLYYLVPTVSCPEAYCFGSASDTDQAVAANSPTPLSASAVSLDWTVETIHHPPPFPPQDQIVFECRVDTDGLDADLDILDVKFKLGEHVFKSFSNVAYGSVQQLKGEEFEYQYDDTTQDRKLAYHKKLRCEAQTRRESGATSTPVYVEKFYGFEVTSPTALQVGEEEEVTISIHLNLPVFSVFGRSFVKVELVTPHFYHDIALCAAGEKLNLMMGFTYCSVEFEPSHEPQTRTLKLKGITQSQFFQPRSMVVKLVSTKDRVNYHISDFPLEPIAVTVFDTKSSIASMACMANGDPIMYLFDGRKWEMHGVGEYILYRNTQHYQEVQIKTERCRTYQWATCVCAVMVRSAASVYVIDTCAGRNLRDVRYAIKYPPRINMYDCAEGQHDMSIERTGNTYLFTFATNTKVTVYLAAYRGHHNVRVVPSPADYKTADGMCGFIDQPGQVQLLRKDGTLAPDADAFAASWTLSRDDPERMFGGREVVFNQLVHYCGCETPVEDRPEGLIVCELSAEHQACINTAQTKALTEPEWDLCQLHKARQRRKREAESKREAGHRRRRAIAEHEEDVMEDGFERQAIEVEDEVPPADTEAPTFHNGWTESSARDFCVDYISNNAATQACREKVSVDDEQSAAIDMCVLDIKITGDTDASATHLETVLAACRETIVMTTDLWEMDATTGRYVLPPSITDAMCPAQCSQRGVCEEGACVCEEGFSGVDCSVDDNAVPEIFRVPNGGLCDLQDWTCRKTKVYAYDLAETFTCKTTLYWVSSDGEQEVETQEQAGENDRLYTGICTLPIPTAQAPQGTLGLLYRISLSNNGRDYSNAGAMVVYDGDCVTCIKDEHDATTCAKKDGTCTIAGSCYWETETHPSLSCLECDPSQSTTDWTLKSSSCLIGGACYGSGEESADNSNDICRPDVSTSQWTSLLDDCVGVVCENGGTCEDGDNAYTCACVDGYEGTHCDVNINECDGVTCEHGGTCQDGVNEYSCSCVEGYEGTHCEIDINECDGVTCEHGGTCQDGVNEYSCSCVEGYEGTHCEIDINECDGVTCEHGGTCQDGVNEYSCSCVEGYEGTHCEININECDGVTCEHGGTCQDGVNEYSCSCVEGYEGTHCEININECDGVTCEHGGTCQDGVNEYSCSCVEGYEGTHCEIDINECDGVTCEHGGTCQDGVNEYSCTCMEGYEGTHCEIDINECDGVTCEHGGTCQDGVNEYSCSCVEGYEGTHCEIEDVCVSSPCVHGRCRNRLNGYTCYCVTGYTGSRCEYKRWEETDWGACNQDCGIGVSTRQRCRDNTCVRRYTEEKLCYGDPCEVDESRVELTVTGSDPLSVHGKLGAMRGIVKENLEGVCEGEPHLCCSGLHAPGVPLREKFRYLFAAEHILMTVLLTDDNSSIPLTLGAEVERAALEEACGVLPEQRRKRDVDGDGEGEDVDMTPIPTEVLYIAWEDSVDSITEKVGMNVSLPRSMQSYADPAQAGNDHMSIWLPILCLLGLVLVVLAASVIYRCHKTNSLKNDTDRYMYATDDAKNGAVDAKNGAVDAKDGAIDAKDGAVDAKNGAVDAKRDASDANHTTTPVTPLRREGTGFSLSGYIGVSRPGSCAHSDISVNMPEPQAS